VQESIVGVQEAIVGVQEANAFT